MQNHKQIMAGIVDDVRTVFQRQTKFVYIPLATLMREHHTSLACVSFGSLIIWGRQIERRS